MFGKIKKEEINSQGILGDLGRFTEELTSGLNLSG